MKTALKVAAFLLLFAWSGYNSFKLSKIESPTNKVTNTQIIQRGQDGKTPMEGVDFTVRDGKDGITVPPKEPKDPRQPVDGKDGADGLNGLSVYELAVRNGFVGSEEEWLYTLRPAPAVTTDIRCNSNTKQFEYKPANVDVWQSILNSKCVV